jgi:PDZ domain-containing secreted protein
MTARDTIADALLMAQRPENVPADVYRLTVVNSSAMNGYLRRADAVIAAVRAMPYEEQADLIEAVLVPQDDGQIALFTGESWR